MSRRANYGLADPSKLRPNDEKDEELFQVVVETPKGSRNKYSFDEDEHIFALKKVLPAGMSFPYDFGFIPSTKADEQGRNDRQHTRSQGGGTGCPRSNPRQFGARLLCPGTVVVVASMECSFEPRRGAGNVVGAVFVIVARSQNASREITAGGWRMGRRADLSQFRVK